MWLSAKKKIKMVGGSLKIWDWEGNTSNCSAGLGFGRNFMWLRAQKNRKIVKWEPEILTLRGKKNEEKWMWPVTDKWLSSKSERWDLERSISLKTKEEKWDYESSWVWVGDKLDIKDMCGWDQKRKKKKKILHTEWLHQWQYNIVFYFFNIFFFKKCKWQDSESVTNTCGIFFLINIFSFQKGKW